MMFEKVFYFYKFDDVWKSFLFIKFLKVLNLLSLKKFLEIEIVYTLAI